MRDFRKLKHHMSEANDLFIGINEDIQKLPDTLDSLEKSEDRDFVFQQIRDIIMGMFEFMGHFDEAYAPFREHVEKMRGEINE